MGQLSGKWALVTGSTRGIGQQIALGLASLGCNIVVHGRKLSSTQATLDLLAETGVETVAVAGELDTMEGIQSIIDAVHEKPGKLDILYNNAAISSPSMSIWETPQALYRKTFDVNVFAIIELCRVFGQEMKAQGWGRIVNLSSGIAKQPNLDPYSLSKAMVDKYTEDLAVELAGTGVLVNTLDPGWLQTDMGGVDAPGKPSDVLPGALVPILLPDDGQTGRKYKAPEYTLLGPLMAE